MLLRNRSRAVTKPALMADHSSQPSPNQNYAKAVPSLFGSPKFRDFTNKYLSGTEALRSPTSILDTRAFSPFGNLLSCDSNEPVFSPNFSSENKTSKDKTDSKGIGLALVDALKDDSIENNSDKPRKTKVVFGTQLKVKIPALPPSTFSSVESETSSADYRIKTQDPLLSPTGSQNSGVLVTSILSLSEMELSEDYTCVISHGPNPRTTHIFDNFIVESYCSLPDNSLSAASANFLSFCYTCQKHLDQTKDIFIYRGDKAFCSHECRDCEIVLDEEENSKYDSYGFF